MFEQTRHFPHDFSVRQRADHADYSTHGAQSNASAPAAGAGSLSDRLLAFGLRLV
jgi:hypothetical protein